MLDRSKFLRPWGFRVARIADGECTLELPHRADLERPGGIMNGPALMAATLRLSWHRPLVSTVLLAGIEATDYTYVSATEMRVQMSPASSGAGTVSVTVVDHGVAATPAVNFTYT